MIAFAAVVADDAGVTFAVVVAASVAYVAADDVATVAVDAAVVAMDIDVAVNVSVAAAALTFPALVAAVSVAQLS